MSAWMITLTRGLVMPNFAVEFQRVMTAEGMTLENVAGDHGGRTYCGISERYNPTWPGWAIIDTNGTADPTLEALVRGFYLANYWQACRCDLLPDPLAGAVFSAAINCGPVVVVQWVQRALNLALDLSLPVDGVMGRDTLSAVGQERSADIEAQFLGYWLRHYIDLAEVDPTQRKFFTGWVRRASAYFAA